MDIKKIQHKNILEEMKEFSEWQIKFRRWLHEHPELMFQEHETSAYLQNELKKLDIPFTTGWGKGEVDGKKTKGTGIVAFIGTKKPPCVGLRSDIDALPITEKVVSKFPSKNPGVMHACGHDAHMAILMCVAKYLKKHENELDGTFCLLFQPAEEGGGGAKYMIQEGCLELSPPVQAVIGLHVGSFFKTGEFYCRPGPVLASASSFQIDVKGKGGHGSMPTQTKDPVATASLIIQGIYTLVARQIGIGDDNEAGVISVTAMETPQAYNVIPSYAVLKGTVRTLSDKKMESLEHSLKEITKKTAEMFDQTGEYTVQEESYPVTFNHHGIYNWAVEQLKETDIVGGLKYMEKPLMASEDFSFFSQKVPGCFFLVGSTAPGTKDIPAMHSDLFCIDENCLLPASAFYAYLAQRLLIQTKKQPFKF